MPLSLVAMRNVDRFFGYARHDHPLTTNYLEHEKSVRSMGNRLRIAGGVETVKKSEDENM